MPSARPVVTMVLGGRPVAVRRTSLRPAEVARVVGESERPVIDRLRCGDLAGVPGHQWRMRTPSAVALVEGKVRCGLLGREALGALAALIEGRPAQRALQRGAGTRPRARS